MFESKKGAPPALATLTLGAVSKRLRLNGYEAVSAFRPDGRLVVSATTHFEPWPTHVASEDPPSIAVKGPLVVLVLAPALLEGEELERRTRALLGDLLGGPVRCGSDGVESRPVRLIGNCQSETALDGAVSIDHSRNVGTHLVPAVLPLDGSWPRGDLTEERNAFTKLPQVDADKLRALFRELDSLPFAMRREKEPPPKPSRRAWLGSAS
jgi:hypothetical protein